VSLSEGTEARRHWTDAPRGQAAQTPRHGYDMRKPIWSTLMADGQKHDEVIMRHVVGIMKAVETLPPESKQAVGHVIRQMIGLLHVVEHHLKSE
jgi:hypothetical protein